MTGMRSRVARGLFAVALLPALTGCDDHCNYEYCEGSVLHTCHTGNYDTWSHDTWRSDEDCTEQGLVCVEKGEYASCVLPEMIPCDDWAEEWRYRCSEDGTTEIRAKCSPTGFVIYEWEEQCDADKEVCAEKGHRADCVGKDLVPCDPTQIIDERWCEDDTTYAQRICSTSVAYFGPTGRVDCAATDPARRCVEADGSATCQN